MISFNEIELYLGAVYDAMRALGFRAEQFYANIKPLVGYRELIHGPAFTTYGEVVDRNIDYSKLDNIRLEMYKKKNFANAPIVILQSNDKRVAHSGDITSQVYQALGAKGFITDGIVRDIDRIDSLKFPLFATDSNPIDALDYWALTKYQVPITIMGITIHPGDYIFASKDGVICVKKEILEEFTDKLISILDKENSARKLITKISASADFEKELLQFVSEKGRW